MSVDDHGLEALRKSAIEVTPGSKSEYKLRTFGTAQFTGLSTAGRVTEVTLNASTWTALPSTALAGRNAMSIQNKTGVEMKVNFSSGVVGYVGMIISDGESRFYDITDSISIYGKSSSGTIVVNVEELS